MALCPTNWIREDVIFSQHGPTPAYFKKFHLPDSDYCSCGGISTALQYATECILTVSSHMRKPVPNFEQEWLQRVANNQRANHGKWVSYALGIELISILLSFLRTFD
ncbi:hypothetical protein AVEN_7447-1 [Araneus ventricosus]|uniref:Uncharacterized protein n=1 Tax=Araneus ventricosus TaxID=182803 RepID=A0A4Y2I239_ARAVE|nr:hypothetical protein AVEN_7447-1 [Araneus ventricosus]